MLEDDEVIAIIFGIGTAMILMAWSFSYLGWV